MDYLYENLGDERFQEFCSCLISKEFPDVQSFPVGQPDGGRDSIVYRMDSKKKEFIVFQVKYVRNSSQDRDVHKWLSDTIEGEVDKINKLIPKGAKKYYLLTNVKGTAHLDVGSKDIVNTILEENIKIPALCWWRDDLSRLFEKDPIFKWSFPEILNGQDILNSALFQQINEYRERREHVIRAYLTEQFENDSEVKFKQIDLQNKLLELFTDVPLRIRKFNQKDPLLRQSLNILNYRRRLYGNEEVPYLTEQTNIGAAEFLLHPEVQNGIKKILLEGGPGQGKSTISQYICQVHRARLLNKTTDINLIPENLNNTPVRLPFRIDLRDVASWTERKNPYPTVLSDEYFHTIWKNTLEAFLIGHIFYHSGLEEFTSTDFIAVCKLSPILFVFDGFDEIANVNVRGEVIELINKGVTRISSNAHSVQVIITSRPAAFSNSVGFSIDNYPHFELTDISTPIINLYVEKWIKASKMNGKEAIELRKLMKEKLEMPHLKDLAKSPMQLAIFISLLRTKGQSLPNKRTALYDSYVELFFDRESEKSSLILDNRELIIEIHQYVAWILHSEAELYKNSGSINVNDLITRLKEYLSKEGHETSIADKLFDAMKERVCALISRIEDTFEFEVQPLREYFCAKYLYQSAPHSSAGSIKQGTKPDRLYAILRNFYWQNVVRFFSGCADAGELDMLIQELSDLQQDSLLKYTNYPRIITSQILSDYVFTQKPLKLKSVVKLIVDGINIGSVVNQDRRYSFNEPLLLPPECGRTELVKECFEQLIKLPSSDYSAELISIINNNPLDNLEIWSESISKFKGRSLTKWLDYGYKLQLIHKINENQLVAILNEGDITEIKRRLQTLIFGNRMDIVNNNLQFKNIVYSSILDSEMVVFGRNKIGNSLNFLSHILHPRILSAIHTNETFNITFIVHVCNVSMNHHDENISTNSFTEFEVLDKIDDEINTFNKSINELFNIPLFRFRNEILLWNHFIESARSIFKDNWSLYIIAIIAAGIKSKEETYHECDDLHNPSVSLCMRVRYARYKSGNPKYWEQQLSSIENRLFTLLVLFTWATPRTIIYLLNTLSKIIKALSSVDLLKLTNGISNAVTTSTFNPIQQRYVEEVMRDKKNNNEINYILSLRLKHRNAQKYIFNNIKKSAGILDRVEESKFQYLIYSFLKEPSNEDILEQIKDSYKNIQSSSDRYSNYRYFKEANKMPYSLAKKVMLDCKKYPRVIGSFAEKTCRLYANQQVVPIGEIANNEKWFEGN